MVRLASGCVPLIGRSSPLVRTGLPRRARLWALAGGLSVLTAALPAQADLAAPGGSRSLGTLINGERGGRCSAGLCVVGGGTAAGNNLFHRLKAFDTRGAIRGVRFDNQRGQTLVVGVTSAWGSWIDKTIEFSKPGNLLLLSPGGVQLGTGAGFLQIDQLGLSTASRLAMQGGGAFDAFSSTALDAAALAGAPLLKADGLQVDPEARLAAGITAVPGIVADGVNVSVDRELLLDAVDGAVEVRDSQLTVQPSAGQGGSLTLAGQTVTLSGASVLKAQGAAAGGLIQIGGSWQNSDPTVRQALATSVDPGVVVDASATQAGNGGTIVAWSDVSNPASLTRAQGQFIAEAGPQGGDGGRIETSGHGLDVAGIRVSTQAPKGTAGVWLLDPSDITISTTTGDLQGVGTNPTVFSAPAANAGIVNVTTLETALGTSNVEITTTGSGSGSGDITLANNVAVNTSTKLTLKADRDIVLNANYTQSGSGSLELLAGQGALIVGAVTGAGTSTISLAGGTLTVETDNTSPGNFSGVISGANANLTKRGAGVFAMAGASTYSGTTTVDAGTLRLTTGGSLADASPLVVNQGATFSLSKSASETIGSISGAGAIALATSQDALTVGSASTTQFSGVISGTGSLTKVGSGTLVLTGSNTYSGGTTINAGSVALDADLANTQQSPPFSYRYGKVSTGLGSGPVAVNSGAELNLTGMKLGNSVTLAAGSTQAIGGSIRNGRYNNPADYDGSYADAELTGTLTLFSSTLALGSRINNGMHLKISGKVTGTGGLYKTGGGYSYLWLTNNSQSANDYSGGTIVAEGALGLGSPSALGAATGQVTVMNGASLDLFGQTLTNANPLTLNGAGGGLGALVNSSQTTATYPGLVTLASDSSIVGETGLIHLTNPGTITGNGFMLTLSGAQGGEIESIIGTGSGGLIKGGAGTWVLNGDNTYTGATTVNAGTLTVNGNSPTTATCNGGSSNVCPTVNNNGGGDQAASDPDPDPDPEPEVADPEPEVATNDGAADDSPTDDSAADATDNQSADSSQDSDPAQDDSVDPGPDPEQIAAAERQEREEALAEAVDEAVEEVIANNPINDTQAELLGGFSDGPEIAASLTDLPAADRTDQGDEGPASLEEAELLGSALGEVSFDSQGVSVEISLGSSFSTESSELGGPDAPGAPTGPAESSDNGVSTPAEEAQEGGDTNAASSASSAAGATTNGTSTAGGRNVSTIPAQEAVQQASEADASQGKAAVDSLTPEAAASGVKSPSPQEIQQSLQGAADQIRRGALGGGQAMTPSIPGKLSREPWPELQPRGDQGLALLAATASASVSASVQTDAGTQSLLPPSFNRALYNPAVLHIRFTEDKAAGAQPSSKADAFLDLTLMPSQGEAVGRRVELSRQEFSRDLKQLYRQLSRQESLDVQNPAAPSRRLYDAIFAAIEPTLQQQGITTLLISADRGLQAVPFAALHNGKRYFGDAFAFALTPSLALTSLAPPLPAGGRLLAAGSAVFDGLAPLPLVPTELDHVGELPSKDKALNRAFTPQTLLEQAGDPQYSRVHVATHAEFLPGGPAASRLYSGTLPIPLSDFVKLRRERQGAPLDLISFSACRTALGDAESELGFAGLALQAGARSAVGTLWYVDDVATSAYFVQMYRYLDAGVPKAEALQLTRQSFSRGLVRLQGDSVLGPDGEVLIAGLTTTQQRRVEAGFGNPYFWAGIELLGSAW